MRAPDASGSSRLNSDCRICVECGAWGLAGSSCDRCGAAQELAIRRLLAVWEGDLRLLERFDAFCRNRGPAI